MKTQVKEKQNFAVNMIITAVLAGFVLAVVFLVSLYFN